MRCRRRNQKAGLFEEATISSSSGKGGSSAKVKDLLEKGADARAVNRYKNTSLHYAMVYKAGPEVVELLLAKGMWANALVMYSADNGGVGDGINWPLRGEKHSSWEGGLRTAAFVSGASSPRRCVAQIGRAHV